jgi:hypothetical protein
VTLDEIESVVRGAGLASLDDVAAVVLETDGTFHVLRDLAGAGSALPPGYRPHGE